MFLSRLVPDVRSREARRDLADIVDLHRTLMRAFPQTAETSARSAFDLLFRVEGDGARPCVLVQSAVRPDWTLLSDGWLLDELQEPGNGAVIELVRAWSTVTSGQELRFRLVANPSRKVKPTDTGKRHSARVPLRSDEDRIAWLARKGRQNGFDLVAVNDDPDVPDTRVTPTGTRIGHKREDGGAHAVTFDTCCFDGRLRVTDLDRFLTGLRKGIGPEKAYGCGLLSIART